MPQLHLYVSEPVAEKIKQRAQATGVSISRYLAQLVQHDLDSGDWPEGFFEEVIGGWQGKPLQRPPQGESETRVRLDSAPEHHTPPSQMGTI
jgi:hypothetical protein